MGFAAVEKKPEQQAAPPQESAPMAEARLQNAQALTAGISELLSGKEIPRNTPNGVEKFRLEGQIGIEQAALAIGAGRNFETPRGNDYGELQLYYERLMSIPEIANNLNNRKIIDGLFFEYAMNEGIIEGKLTEEGAGRMMTENWGRLDQVKDWTGYASYQQSTNAMLSNVGASFRFSGTVALGFSSSASSVPRVVGTQLDVGKWLGKTAVGGQLEAARKLGGSYGRVRLGESEQEEGFLMAGGDARKTPTTREDAGQLDVRLANLAASVLAETLEEDKGRIGNNVAEARSGRFAS